MSKNLTINRNKIEKDTVVTLKDCKRICCVRKLRRFRIWEHSQWLDIRVAITFRFGSLVWYSNGNSFHRYFFCDSVYSLFYLLFFALSILSFQYVHYLLNKLWKIIKINGNTTNNLQIISFYVDAEKKQYMFYL